MSSGVLEAPLRSAEACPRTLRMTSHPWCALPLLATLLTPLASFAHEVRPAYLELREGQAGEFAVLWKTPMRGDLRLALAPEFSGRSENLTPVATRERGGAAVQTWRMKTIEPLRGQSLRIRGLDATMTDALARIEFADGRTWLRRLTPQEPAATIPATQSAWSVAGEYLTLGVEHILRGVDHLLFVLALLLITRGTNRLLKNSPDALRRAQGGRNSSMNPGRGSAHAELVEAWGGVSPQPARRLVKTVTAFTVAHSITLALAALGFVHVPQAPVEAVIALSIAFVAAEILRARDGREGVAARAPWIVAFAFGLLHGFGFASALSAIGLPEGHIPLALLFFNVGVELGQLLFIAAMLGFIAAVRRVRFPVPGWATLVPPYVIGSVAMFWVVQRVAAF